MTRVWLSCWDSIGDPFYWLGIHALWLSFAAVGAVVGALVGAVVGDVSLGAFAGGMVGVGIALLWLVLALVWRRRAARTREPFEPFVK